MLLELVSLQQWDRPIGESNWLRLWPLLLLMRPAVAARRSNSSTNITTTGRWKMPQAPGRQVMMQLNCRAMVSVFGSLPLDR